MAKASSETSIARDWQRCVHPVSDKSLFARSNILSVGQGWLNVVEGA